MGGQIKTALIYIFSKIIKMKNGTRIYLGNNTEALDTNEDFDLRMNYTLADATEPTAVKNSWSRTVKLPATKRNNRILGHIYNSDWELLVNNFNPNTRIEYKMYIDCELVQTGYVQLDNIVRNLKGKYEYEMTFYGGLGDFFYNLSIDEETGETKKLSDLRWGVKDADGNLLEKDKEFNFKINKEFIDKNWKHLATFTEDGTINDFISFAPMYNGTPGEIDSSKILLNIKDVAMFENYTALTAYNGYYMTELNDKMDEWATHDLRSYLQRPVVRMKKFMEAVKNPENNGGYEVELDPTFFNDKNVYYENAYMTLPLLSFPDDYGSGGSTTKVSDKNSWQLGGETAPVNVKTNIIYNSGQTTSTESGGTVLNINNVDSDVSFNFKFTVNFTPTDKASANKYDDLCLFPNFNEGTGIRCQIWIYDADNGEELFNNGQGVIITDSVQISEMNEKYTVGKFKKNEDGTWTMRDLHAEITANFIRSPQRIYTIVQIGKYIIYGAQREYGLGHPLTSTSAEWFDGVFDISIEGFYVIAENNKLASNSEITKTVLFNNDSDNSVLNFMLSYTKRFGLVWQKDLLTKKIKVWKRDTFYASGDIIDLNDKIDYNNDVTILPLNFDRRFYVFRDKMNENYYSQMYKTQYSKEYGQKRIDTNYPFNDETEEMTADSIFYEIPEVNANASYNRNYYTVEGDNCFGWLNNCKDILYSYERQTQTTKNIDFDFTKKIGGYTWLTDVSGNDWTNRPSCAKEDNAAGTLDYTLLFFTGFREAKDAYKYPINYYVTDDVDEMFALNDGNSMWLYTQGEDDVNGNQIAIKRNTLPIFSRWMTDEDEVVDSWDFGTPVELYVRGVTMPEDANLYGKFWKKYQEDQFDVNSRTLTCYVDMRKMKGSTLLLGNFYTFQNAVWVLSEINDYDITSDASVECKFIKVLNKKNYTDGQAKTN